MTTKPTFYGITATSQTSWYDVRGNQRIGMNWYIVSGPCATRTQAGEQGREQIGNIDGDIYRETEHKNFRIVSKSSLKREYRIDPDASVEYDMFCDE
jgi:hypothetical protein